MERTPAKKWSKLTKPLYGLVSGLRIPGCGSDHFCWCKRQTTKTWSIPSFLRLRLSLRSLRIGRSWFRDHDLVVPQALVRRRARRRCRRHARRRAGAETARSLVYQSPETIFSDITIHFGPIERAASGQASAAPLAAGEGGRRRGACAARPAMHTDRPARRPWVLALRYRTAYQLRQAGQSRTRSQHRHFAG